MIRCLEQKDKENWSKLYNGYADFYKVPMNKEILETLWGWIHDDSHIINGICYELEDRIVGIAHYRTMPRPIKGKYIGFLDDLYVDPKHRRNGIGEKIIKELNTISSRNNWNLVRWITRDDNIKAKSLYEKLSKKTNWEVYELS